ncbi:MAG: hypothetical protein JXR49_23630 [Acidobacteria bacterium]|nr:hypothetical protein [Acidobacteriota bacterium]
MKVVVATGCPLSGWERVLPILDQMNLKPAGDDFTQWLDDLLPVNESPEEHEITEITQPKPEMIERITELLQDHSDKTLLLADSRNLKLLDFWAEKLPQATFLLFYNRAEIAVAHAISKGLDLQHFLNTWEESNYRLLRFQRRYRQRALLFNAHSVIQQPQDIIPVCDRFGLVLQNKAAAVPPSTLSSLDKLLASYWVESQPSLDILQAELEASAYPLGDSPMDLQLQPMELLADFRQRREKEQSVHQKIIDIEGELRNARQALQSLREKNAALQNALKERDSALEGLRSELKVQQDKISQLQGSLEEHDAEMIKLAGKQRTQLEAVQKSHNRLEADHEGVVNENKLLFQQLLQVQEELETVFLQKHSLDTEHQQIQQLRQALLIKERELEERERFLIRVKESVFWKIAAPLRSVLRPFIQGNKANLQTQTNLIRSSGFFDEAWYLAQYPDVKKNGADPVEHYLRYGTAKGYNPSSGFHTRNYLEENPDVAKAGLNPLVHYIQYGRAEGRIPNP